MTVTTLRIAFSPDSDDLFMFWPLLSGRIASPGLRFEVTRADTEALNERAEKAIDDVVAISVGTYPRVASEYLLLPHGGSVGRGYGPMVVARSACNLESLRGKRIAIPGLRTTAYLVLRLLLPDFEAVVVPIQPYARVFRALSDGEVDAALLIHEGRLTFANEGCYAVEDIGRAWAVRTSGLPLPLGGNAIRRALGPARIAEVSSLLRQSIRWALDHREELIDQLLADASRPDLVLSRDLLDRYLAMYANADTLGYPEDARHAIEQLLDAARGAGLVPPFPHVEWAP